MLSEAIRKLDVNARYVPALVGIAQVVADEVLQRALAINPNSVQALETYAQLLMINGREQEAEEYFDKVLELNPESLKTLSVLAASAALEERMDDFAGINSGLKHSAPATLNFWGISQTASEIIIGSRRQCIRARQH